MLASDADTFQPHFSPDGTEIAYLEERTTLKVLNLKTGKSRTMLPGDMNYSYSDGDQWYEWSPDGRWFAVQFLSNTRWSSEVGLIPSSGEGALVNVTKSGYEDVHPHVRQEGRGPDLADRPPRPAQPGRRGPRVRRLRRVPHRQGVGPLPPRRGRVRPAQGEGEGGGEGQGQGDGEGQGGRRRGEGRRRPEPEVAIEFAGLDDRIARLSPFSAQLGGMALSPDGETLYDLAKFEKGYDLWKYVPRTKEIKLLAKLDAKEADLKLDRDGKKAFVLADSKLLTVDLESGKTSPVKASAMMELNPAAERAYLFEHIWRQTWKKFLVEDMHGVDWKATGDRVRPLPPLHRQRPRLRRADLRDAGRAERVAHRRPLPAAPPGPGDETAALGFFPDPKHAGPGVGILEVIEGGPLQTGGDEDPAPGR